MVQGLGYQNATVQYPFQCLLHSALLKLEAVATGAFMHPIKAGDQDLIVCTHVYRFDLGSCKFTVCNADNGCTLPNV